MQIIEAELNGKKYDFEIHIEASYIGAQIHLIYVRPKEPLLDPFFIWVTQKREDFIFDYNKIDNIAFKEVIIAEIKKELFK